MVPIPTLLPETVMGEALPAPNVAGPEYTGTAPETPLLPFVTGIPVCAAAPADINAKPKPSHMHADFLIFPILSSPPLLFALQGRTNFYASDCRRRKHTRPLPRSTASKSAETERPFKEFGVANADYL